MNYIYDIILNFNKLYYDFYEWKDNDNILNFRKIPLFRISDKDYMCYKYDDIRFDGKFLKIINGYSCLVNSNTEIVAFLVSNSKEVMGIKIDNNGNIMGRSSLLIDEEEEILDDVSGLNINRIDYSIIKKNDRNIFVPRIINDKRKYLIDFFNNNSDINIYRYIYYDFYEREEKDIVKIKKKLFGIFNCKWNNECDKLYNSIREFSNCR